jgi:hypothetical protein
MGGSRQVFDSTVNLLWELYGGLVFQGRLSRSTVISFDSGSLNLIPFDVSQACALCQARRQARR